MIYSKIEDYERDRKELISHLSVGEELDKYLDTDKLPEHFKTSMQTLNKTLNVLKQSTWINNTSANSSSNDDEKIIENIEKQLRENKKKVFILFAGTGTENSIKDITLLCNCTTKEFVAATSTIISNYAKDTGIYVNHLLNLINMYIHMGGEEVLIHH